MLRLTTPVQMRLVGYDSVEPKIRAELTYTDKAADWAYRKFLAGRQWHVRRLGEAGFEVELQNLAAARKKCLLFRDEEGLWTWSGLRPLFESQFGDEARREYDLPKPQLIPWASVPALTPRYYQDEMEARLLEGAPFGPDGVEVGTGLGKSFVIMKLLKALGLRAVVMTPSVSIARQIYDELVHHFGKSRVGLLGDKSKEFKKLFTVGVAASLRNVEIGTPAWEALSSAQVFIADESHQCPAETLSMVCFGLCANAPYRFFFSGTQLRQDGKDLLLDAITGPIVYRMSVREGIDQGFLAKVLFRMCWMDSNVRDRDRNLVYSPDANVMTRKHAFYNPELNAKAAEFANKAVALQERPTVIMVDEIEQVKYLLPHLRYEARFAHGPLTKENKEFVPEQMWEVDNKKLVEQFNAGEFPILIGTSCIRTGTDIKRVKTLINLCQGKSEVDVRQTIGRCTRLAPGKEDCVYIDFGIRNVEILEKHANARKKIYDEVYPSYREFSL